MVNVSWDEDDVIYMGSFEPCNDTNLEHYIAWLNILKLQLSRIQKHKKKICCETITPNLASYELIKR